MNTVLNGNMDESSSKKEKGFYPNTELGIDLKLISRKPGRLGIGEYLDGAITHDGEDHFTFVQNDSEKKKDAVIADLKEKEKELKEIKRKNWYKKMVKWIDRYHSLRDKIRPPKDEGDKQ